MGRPRIRHHVLTRPSWIEDAVRDLRIGLRSTARNPIFSSVAILTLALGIGATTAVFSIVNALLLKPLAYPNSDRLVRILEHVPAEETARRLPEVRAQMNKDEFAAWRTRIKSLSHMAVYASQPQTLTTRAGAVRVLVGTGFSRPILDARTAAAIGPRIGSRRRAGPMPTRW
jgi:hypothetical protein